MKMQINFYFLLGIITFLFDVTNAYHHAIYSNVSRFKSPIPKPNVIPHPMSHPIPKPLQNSSKQIPSQPLENPFQNPDDEKKDQFYLIIVENYKTNDTTIENSKMKRELNDMYIDGLVDEINSLIVGNRDSYVNPEKLDELDDEAAQLRKRDGEDPFALDYGNSNYVYKISSTENKTVLYAYLSNILSETVDTMPQVISCKPDRKIKYTLDYSQNEVLRETKWDGITARNDVKTHLSAISQGEFDEDRVHEYDNTYYYPKSAGQDINIVVLDTQFNFDFSEFENSGRTVECSYLVRDAKILNNSNKKYCYGANDNSHGTKVADAAAGLNSGVAPKANVYGVLYDHNAEEDGYMTHANVIAAFETIKSKLIVPYKTVVNVSQGYQYSENASEGEKKESEYILELIAEISKKAVVVVSAGNKNEQLTYKDSTHKMYCYSKDVICVGGIENFGSSQDSMKNDNYRKAPNSNYGECVDIYAPYSARVLYNDRDSKTFIATINGTSISSPIVAGVAATIMSDQPEVRYNTQSMKEYLKKIAIKGAISGLSSDSNNLFINNGKHIVYSGDNVYYGCGVESGNLKCGKGECCSQYGYCGTSSRHCGSGCQPKFGICN